MAKGTNIGFLNFGIDGDDTEFKKKLAALKNDAISIENIFKNIKIKSGGSGNISADITKAQLASDKLLISSTRVGEARERAAALSLISEQRLNNELGRGMQIQRQSELVTARITATQENATNRRLLNERRIQSEAERTIAMQLLNSSRISSIDAERMRRDSLNEQRRQSEILRTEMLRQRLLTQSTSSQNQLNRSLDLTNKTMFSQKALLQQITNALGIYFSIYQVGAFVKELAMVSGEFEKQRASLAAILQDSDAANKLFGQIKDLAVISPFNFMELTGYAKQLSAFSIPTNEIYDTMKRLADVSAGLGVDMNRIILAYGQVRSASVLRGQELRQFTEAGIPLVDELAKKFSALSGEVVKAGDVFDKISNREVPFAMVKEIFTELTSEGGKFFEMQEIQSATLAGKISNLRDAYDIMLDSIGSANSSLLKGSVSGLVDIMDNWEKYWKILKGIILTYGTYKAVIIATSIAQKAMVASETIMWFINLQRALTGATSATAAFALATNSLKAALITNPITAVASALGVLVGSMILLSKETKSIEELMADLDKSTTELASSLDESQNRIEKLGNTYKELSSKTNRNEAEQKKLDSVMAQLAKTVPNAAKEFDEYGRVLSINLNVVKNYTEEQKKFARERLKNQMDAAQLEANALQKQVDTYSDIIQNGLKGTSAGTMGYQEFRTPLNEKQLIEYQNKRADISDKLVSITNRLAEAQKALNGELSNTTENTEGLAYFAQQINAQIDKLNFGQDLKDKIKITDVTKDFDTVQEETGKFFDDWNAKVKSMEAAPMLFLPSDINKAKEMLSLYSQLVTIVGATTKKTSGSQKDKFTDDLKDQVELIKQAKSEYEKLLKVMSADEASKKLKTVDPYKNIDIANLSDSGYESYLKSQLEKIEKRNTDTAKSVRITWNKELAQIQVEKITDDAKKAMDKLEKILSQDKERFNLYQQIFGITGDKSQAAKAAFGDPNKIVGDYLDILKEAFNTKSGISFSDFINLDDNSKDKLLLQDDVKKLAEDIQNTEWTNKADFSKQMAQLVAEYRTVDEQITVIRSKGEATRLQILKNTDNASQDMVEKRLMANKEAISKGIADLTNGALQATDSYQRLFGEIGDISERELTYMIEKWKKILSEATKNGDGNLVIRVDGKDFTTTEREAANFTKRIIKSETELRNRNPFKALKASLDELSNNRGKIKEIEAEIKSLGKIRDAALFENAQGKGNAATDHIIESTSSNITKLKDKLADLSAQGATSFMKVGASIGAIGQTASELGQSLSGMFEALGNEGLADTIGFMGELADSASQIGEGLASKDPIKVIKGIIGGITSIANFHDKKLDRAIQKSQLEVKKLGNAYNELQRTISRQLGAISESQSQEMIDNQAKQISELEKQREAESKKKKKDKSLLLDLDDQIAEAKDKLKYFYEDLASEQFGINIKDWAGTLADSLVDAFASGKNAAKSFDQSVADIMKNVVKNMISLQVIQPAMEKLRDYLFGDKGVFTDGELSSSDAAGLVGQLADLKGSIGDAKTIWDALNQAAKEVGVNLEDTAKQDTLSKGIQAVTEDTASLLASYVNSMRADLASQLAEIRRIVLFSENSNTTFALMLAELVRIQVNTFNTANNTARLVELSEDTNLLLHSATIKNGATRWNGL